MPFDWLHQNVNGRRGPLAIIYFHNDQLNTATDVEATEILHLPAFDDNLISPPPQSETVADVGSHRRCPLKR